MEIKIRKIENAHIFLWLCKDICWIMGWKILGVCMIIPTLFLAFLITWKSKSVFSELSHNLAVCCWICANSVWMIGEFFFEDTTRRYALCFFMTGFIVLFYYYIIKGNIRDLFSKQ